MALGVRPDAAIRHWELKQVLNILKNAICRESENREGLTLVESMAIVGAMAAFVSIYTYIVVGALMSAPMPISL